MAKVIDSEMVYWALCKTVLSHSLLTPAEQRIRPIRQLTHGDEVQTAGTLKDFRVLWAGKIALLKTTGEKTVFPLCKSDFFDHQMSVKGWTIQTRNLYASAVSIYMTWDRKESRISPRTKQGMIRLASYTRFILEAKPPSP